MSRINEYIAIIGMLQGGILAALLLTDRRMNTASRILGVLAANPFDDIANTSSIDLVVSAGRVFDRATLDAMLAAVADAHAESRQFDLELYQGR